MRPLRLAVACVVIAAIMSPAAGTARTSAERTVGASTPALIERAVAAGRLDQVTADRYLLAAIRGEEIPQGYVGDQPWDGTIVLMELEDRVDEMPAGPQRRELRSELHPNGAGAGTDTCGSSTAPLANTTTTDHFYIEYGPIAPPLTIEHYKASLEGAWTTEVSTFGWAAPPVLAASPPPSNKYHVRIEPLGPLYYGYVADVGTHAGFVGNNPNTAWPDGDAHASCMVLNADFGSFPAEPQQALDATTAHELNHSIQYGYGALDGPNAPDVSFTEGGATWMEDEVYDNANDSYHYLWPDFADDMGHYRDNNTVLNPYSYWITWRGITEPYGTTSSGGGEDAMQRFWELTSQNAADSIEALDRSLEAEGTNLPTAYHAYAIAVKFNRPCGGEYQRPFCLEEGPAYVATRGPTEAHGSLGGIGSRYASSILDNYALNWIALPTTGPQFQTVLRNTSRGGRLRASIACDTGSRIRVEPFERVANAGETTFERSFDPAGCVSAVAVVTNVNQTSPNPGSSTSRSYELAVTTAPAPSKTKLRVRTSRSQVLATGRVRPRHRGENVHLTLFRRARAGWRLAAAKETSLKRGKRFGATFPLPAGARCRVEAVFQGDTDHLPSTARRSFSC